MRARRGSWGVVVALAVALGACQPGTVTLAFAPEAGSVHEYRYEIVGTIIQAIDGAPPVESTLAATLEVTEEVVLVRADGVRARLSVRRDGGQARSVDVRLDRAGSLQGIDLVEGRPAETFGLGVLQSLLSAVALPTGPLAPGHRWSVDDDQREGTGRLARLAVVDGHRVAVVDTKVAQALDEQLPTNETTARLTGTITSWATTSYDLADGSVRRSSATVEGRVDALVQPPPGVTGSPVPGTITYELAVTVLRTA